MPYGASSARGSRERLLGGVGGAVAAVQAGPDPRGERGDGHDHAGFFGTMRRAARRDVRKYDRV